MYIVTDESSFYDRWSRPYDVFASNPVVDSWREEAVQTIDPDPADVVVEMGCGSGANFTHLREAVGDNGRVIGLDLSEGILTHARERVVENGWDNVDVIRADATNPPIEEVDVIFSSFVTGMFHSPRRVVENWCTLISDEGKVGILDVAKSDHDASPLINAGLDAFTGLTASGPSFKGKLEWTLEGNPLAELTSDVEAGHGVIKRQATDVETTQFGLDSVHLTVGRFEDED